MDFALLASITLATIAVLFAYFIHKRQDAILEQVKVLLAQAQDQTVQSIVGQVESKVPELQALKRDLESTWGKATRAIRTFKHKTEQEPDDDDLLHALNHPFAQGLIETLGLDAGKLAAGDSAEFAKAQELLKTGHIGQQSLQNTTLL